MRKTIKEDGTRLTSSEKSKRYRQNKEKKHQDFLKSLVKRVEFNTETNEFIELHPNDDGYYSFWYETSDYLLYRLKLLDNSKNKTTDEINEIRIIEKLLKDIFPDMF
ncbi:hypothetical protein GOB86_10025 [Acetobacter lambici]|uniref:Uncharacterized protein n=1 Tax=Acetobacter lambici TaxID=1332824 RepID=A0ABT1F116_9PROT|nr:hypothetical protein [Acetobacter lambici]MCP1242747.1 hypothetical protein [Acetobacter lambici]MCP1258880.1 hypothetical protein [Acetobacter lambici]NHO57389.1 hypothetical protein [Acetobacter lambici]